MPDDLTIDAAVDAAFDQAFSSDSAAEPKTELADALDATETGNGADRPRDEKGRFAPKAADDGAEPEKEPETADAADDAEPDSEITDQGKTEAKIEPAPAPAVPAIDPPQSWSAAEREHWGSLSPDVQRTVLRRESDFQRYAQQVAERINNDPVRQALEPVRQQLQLSGVDEGAYVRSLVTAAQLLETKPYEAIAWLAHQKGVDLTQFGAAKNQDVDEENPIDPRFQALQQRVEQLTQHITQQAQESERQRQVVEQTTVSQLQKSINDFSNSPENKYFARVRDSMAAMARAGISDDLKVLYDQAVWANPETRAELLAEQTAAARAQAEKAAAEERKKIENAAAAKRLKAATAATPRVRNEPGSRAATSRVGPSAVEDAVDSTFDALFGA